MEFGSPDPVRSYVMPNNVRLGDWLHEQCKKYKDDRLSESCVKTLNGLGVQFEKQRNVVGKRYTVATAIFAIHKYEKEHGHIKVNKTEDPPPIPLDHSCQGCISNYYRTRSWQCQIHSAPFDFTPQTGAYSPTSQVQTATRTNDQGYREWQCIS
jgi:hypothetical protein